MDVLESLGLLEGSDELHESRLLLLLAAFAKGKDAHGIAGLTKLAKLDFLLRYPVLLERALSAKGRSTQSVELQEYERESVESRMVRYRFGPWDHRYRRFLNLLAAKNLIHVDIASRPIQIIPTKDGLKLAQELSESDAFKDIARRAGALKTHFDVRGTHLMRFIYDTFPEVVSLKSNEAIDL